MTLAVDLMAVAVFGAMLLLPLALVGFTMFVWIRDWRELRILRLETARERQARRRRRELKLWVNPNRPPPRDE